MDWLETAVQISVVAGAIGGLISFLINFVVLRPLEATLARLQLAVDHLAEQLARAEERWHEVDRKLAAVDQCAKSAHKRLDEHYKYCHRGERDAADLEHR